MDETGKNLFARSALTRNQDRCRGGGYAASELKHPLHGGAVACEKILVGIDFAGHQLLC
jgi:hypothetical protein